MRGQPKSFAQHVAAAWREGLSMGAYAKKHGLAPSTLYRWQQKLRLRQGAQSAQSMQPHSLVDADTPTQACEQASQPGDTAPAHPRLQPGAGQSTFVTLRIARPESMDMDTGTGTNANDKKSVTACAPLPASRTPAPKHRHAVPSVRAQTRPHPLGRPVVAPFIHSHDHESTANDTDKPSHCTLILPGAIRVQMPAPPDPAWLVALSVCAQGAY